MIRLLARRPVGVLAVTVTLLLLGLFAGSDLPVGLMPDEPQPLLTVDLEAPGYAAQDIESQLIPVLRAQLRALPRLHSIQTFASQEAATLQLSFDWGASLDDLYLLLSEAIDQCRSVLPPDLPRPEIRPPVLSPIPIAQIAVTADHWSPARLRDWCRQQGRQRFVQLPGIAHCELIGGQEVVYEFRPNLARITAAHLSLSQIRQALKAAQFPTTDLVLPDGAYQQAISIRSGLQEMDHLQAFPIPLREGTYLPLHEFGSIHLRTAAGQHLATDGQQAAVHLRLYEQANSNLLHLSESLESVITAIAEAEPELHIRLLDDQSAWIRWSLQGLAESAVWGAVCAVLVLLLVLRSWRAPLLMALTIPTTLLLSAGCFHLLGLGLNLMTMAGLALGIGVLIDNGIVVVEQIQRLRQQGIPGGRAVVQGAQMMAAPLIGSTATTLSMFVPLWLAHGQAGALFRDLGLAVAIALLMSLVVALWLLPVVDRLLPWRSIFPPSQPLPPKGKGLQSIRVQRKQSTVLSPLLWERARVRAIHLLISGGLLLLILVLGFRAIPGELFPALSLDEVDVEIRWEAGSSLEQSRSQSLRLSEAVFSQYANSAQIGAVPAAGPPRGQESVVFRVAIPLSDQAAVKAALSDWMALHAPAAQWSWSQPEHSLVQWIGREDGLQDWKLLPISADQDIRRLQPWLDQLAASPTVRRLVLPFSQREAQLWVYPRLAVLAQHGIAPDELADFLRSLLGAPELLSWSVANQQESLRLAAPTQDWPSILQSTTYRQLPLSALIRWESGSTPQVMTGDRHQAFHLLQLETTEAISAAQLQTWQAEALALGWQLLPDPKQAEVAASQRELLWLFGMGMLLLLVVLTAQFESLWLPLVILSTVPFGMAGSLLLLLLAGASLNLMSGLGLIIVSGIVVNDAILKVDAIRAQLKAGVAIDAAIAAAGKLRFRAIVLTSATTILAMTPILFADGVGGELQAPLALSVIGGIVAGTLASMWWIPAVMRVVKNGSLRCQKSEVRGET